MKRQSQQGLTIIEILVALSLLSIMLVSIVSILPGLYKTTKDNTDYQSINAYARNVMEVSKKYLLAPPPPSTTTTTTSTAAKDLYPNLKSASYSDFTTKGYSLPAQPTGVTCANPDFKTVTGTWRTLTIGRRVLVTLTCTASNNRSFNYYQEVGRPE